MRRPSPRRSDARVVHRDLRRAERELRAPHQRLPLLGAEVTAIAGR